MVALLTLSSCCNSVVRIMCLFLMVPWVCLQCVIVLFPGHTHIFFRKSGKGSIVIGVQIIYQHCFLSANGI